MWVRLNVCKQVVVNGAPKNLQPGDWANVGKQDARMWIAVGDAFVPKYSAIIPEGSGAVLAQKSEGASEIFKRLGLSVKFGDPEISFSRTLLWDVKTSLKANLIPIGLGLLDMWEMAVPVMDYDTLACHVGTKKDQAETKTLIHDLRVPMYDTGAVFVKDCPATRAFMRRWGGGTEHAFLRALYQTRPLVLALPKTWTSNEE